MRFSKANDAPKPACIAERRLIMNTRMKTRFLCLTIALLLTVPLYARDKTDVMVMTNGDRLTCEVKGLDAGVLYVSFDYIDGTASVNWSKVARLESKQLFVVKTEGGAVYTGTLRTPDTPTDRPVKIQVLAAEKEDVFDRSQIVQMVATSDKFWQRFNGDVSFGVIYSKGNQSTEYSLGSQTAYVRERWTALADFNSNLSSSSGTSASTRNAVNFGGRHLLRWNDWFYAGLGAFLQSSEQGIALQSTVGGGIGRYFKNTNRTSISLLLGPAWQNTEYKQSDVPVNNQNVAAAIVYGQAQFFKFSKTNLNVTAALLPALSDPGRVRFNTNASYYIKIVSNLKWNVSFYGNWDNRPPPGFSGSDYGTSSGLSWTFGLK
jgi:putative salt-induced outer membrane protein YdiY